MTLASPDKKDRDARAAILQAAVTAFGHHGLQGARTQAIADEAGVNIALVFYYFEDKNRLYREALESVFDLWAGRLLSALDRNGSELERIQRYAEMAFDFVAENPARARLVQAEIIQDVKGHRIESLVKKYFAPVRQRLRELLRTAIVQGVIRQDDPDDLITSMHGVVLGHFNASSIIEIVTGEDPLTNESIRRRRESALKFINQALLASPPR
jgi:AcrR family transcriptional regulator